jgi:uncharacterized delta-60 repeat protein
MKRTFGLLYILVNVFFTAKAQSGSVDTTFKSHFIFKKSHIIDRVQIQKDGKILLFGFFDSVYLNGSKINNVIRLNADGSVDSTFKIRSGFNKTVYQVTSQPDKKILIGGLFDRYNNLPCKGLVRLNTDGSIDTSFKPPTFAEPFFSLVLQKDNKIVVGTYEEYHSTFFRLNSNGSLDSSFHKVEANHVCDIQAQGDKFILAGYFTHIGGISRNFIARIYNNGVIDDSFKPVYNWNFIGGSLNHSVIQQDGKIIAVGYFVAGQGNFVKVFRLNQDGGLDSSFKGGDDFQEMFPVYSIFLQNNGKIIFGGYFNWYHGTKNNNIVCSNSDGPIDSTFISGEGFDAYVSFIGLQSRNKIIVVGGFNQYNTYLSNRIIRLNIEDSYLSVPRDEVDTKQVISITPNPSRGHFRVRSSKTIQSVIVSNSVGEQVLNTVLASNDIEINLTELPEGLYYVKLNSENQSTVRKIFKLQ